MSLFYYFHPAHGSLLIDLWANVQTYFEAFLPIVNNRVMINAVTTIYVKQTLQASLWLSTVQPLRFTHSCLQNLKANNAFSLRKGNSSQNQSQNIQHTV